MDYVPFVSQDDELPLTVGINMVQSTDIRLFSVKAWLCECGPHPRGPEKKFEGGM